MLLGVVSMENLNLSKILPRGAPPPLGARATSGQRHFAAREKLFARGEAAPQPFRIVSGAVMAFRSLTGGRRQILDIAGPGRVIGFGPDGRHDCDALALVPSLVAVVKPREADRSAAMLAEIARLRDHATLLGRKTAIERLASFLIESADPWAQGPQDLDFPVSRQEIADYLGLVIETVSRNFVALRKRGLITPLGRDNVRIEDFCGLRRIAAGADATLS